MGSHAVKSIFSNSALRYLEASVRSFMSSMKNKGPKMDP